MTEIWPHWQSARQTLEAELPRQVEQNQAFTAVRNSLAQTEQRAMAAASDDILRQQIGLWFQSLRGSVALLKVPRAVETWQLRSPKERKSPAFDPLLLALLLICALMALSAWLEKMWLWMILSVVAAALALILLIRKAPAWKDTSPLRTENRVFLDREELLRLLDEEIRGMEHALTDLTYLNEQLMGDPACTDRGMMEKFATLLESLYDCEGESGEEAITTARQILSAMGATPLNYTPTDSRYFNVLPTKNGARTIRPALIARKDGALLTMGVATDSVTENTL